MFKIRFFISVSIYTAVSIILPFLVPVPMKSYFTLMAIFTLGYLVPSVFSVRQKLPMSGLIWITGAFISLVIYDYIKSITEPNYVFMQNYVKLFSTGLFILLGLQLYSRFTSELVFKQLTKK